MNVIILLLITAVAGLSAFFLFLRCRRLRNLSDNLSVQYSALSTLLDDTEKGMKRAMDSVSSPVMIIDGEGKISFANGEAKKLAGRPEMEGHSYLEFVKEPEFIGAVQTVHRDGQAVEKEIVLDRRIYLTAFAPLGEAGNILVLWRDITAGKELERVKRELVTNMSHELKTPLTVIKGYVETLYEEIPAELKGYLDVIKKHTERLVSIVSDILSLSGLEEVRTKEFGQVDIREVMNDVARMYAGGIKDKNLNFVMELDGESSFVTGDRFRLEELFINLLDNAVRYTDKGTITVKSCRRDNYLVVSIRDTGIGIPEHSLPRIFERFYVVDKSRSRETGGTGLGLSIVKHIVTVHKGTVEIKSRAGSGTEVVVTLPLYTKSS